jgi:CDP-L-myo-inositol myo-inositolphosphotransferase
LAHLTLVFAKAATANFVVAGIPAAARAALAVERAAQFAPRPLRCSIAVAGGWTPSGWCLKELERLAPTLEIDFCDSTLIERETDRVFVCGEDLPDERAVLAALRNHCPGRPRDCHLRYLDEPTAIAKLKRAGDAIIAATGKASDGIVSRYLNRPISRAISRLLLLIPTVTPFYATLGTGALAIAMAACLFFGGQTGLIAGALLYQSASIFDGVDGEIARATYRTSESGATLDSLIDAATNLAFIAGLTFNLWLQGFQAAGTAGLCGFLMLAAGLALVGRMARKSGGSFNFDAIKSRVGQDKSLVMRWLTYLTMRDFYAAAATLLVLLGLGPEALVIFCVVTAGWLMVVLMVCLRESRWLRASRNPHADRA